jgi:hypothetical protein
MSKSRTSAPSLVRTVMQSITLGRDGKVVNPTVGQTFEFTAEEIEQIEKANPAAISVIATLDLSNEVAADAVKAASSEQSGKGDL